MKNQLKLWVICIIIFLFFISFAKAKESAVVEGIPAFDFQLPDLNENTISLSSYKDKQPVILFLWTTWCPFCLRELKSLNEMYPALADEGFEVLSINVGESLARVAKFTKNYSLKYKVLLDKDTYVADYYGVRGVPTFIIVDKKGYIRFQDNYFPKKEYKDLIAE